MLLEKQLIFILRTTRNKNAFCEQNLELLNIKADLFDITTVL